MIRIAYLSTDPGIAYGGTKGASVHLAEITDALARRGATVLLLVSRAEPTAPSPPAGVAVEVLPGPGKGATVDERLAAEDARAEWLGSRLAAFGADCLHERLALHSAAGSTAAARLGIPHLVEINAPLRAEAARYRTLERAEEAERLERRALSGAAAAIVVSQPLVAYARQQGAGRVEVLANAVAMHRFPETPPPSDPPGAVFAGTLRPWHGVDVVARAWQLLGNDAPPLLVIGDGPGREALEAIGAEVTGPVAHDDVPALLRAGDIGLAPYTADGPRYFSPLKLFEYLAAGLATVAGDLPGVVDVVTPELAVVVPAGSAEALAETVAGLAADPERRQRLGRAGRALVTAAHTWDHRARSVLDLVGSFAPAGAGR